MQISAVSYGGDGYTATAGSHIGVGESLGEAIAKCQSRVLVYLAHCAASNHRSLGDITWEVDCTSAKPTGVA